MQPAPSICFPQSSELAESTATQKDTTETRRALRETCIEQVTLRDAFYVRPDVSILDATKQLLDAGADHAPVITQAGLPVGVLSQSDLLSAWQDVARRFSSAVHAQTAQAPTSKLPDTSSKSTQDTSVSEIMMPYVIAVKTSDPLSLATNLMAYEGVSQLLVLDSNKKYVGVVTAQNILNWVAQWSGGDMGQDANTRNSAALETVQG